MRRSVAKLHQRFLKKANHDPKPAKPRLEVVLGVLEVPPKDRTQLQVQELGQFMQCLSFFADLTKSLDREALLQCCQFMTLEKYEEGEFVFHADEEGRKFFVVLSGSVTVLRPDGRVDGQKTYQQLAILKEGASFGELALIKSSLRAASILCREPTALGVLSRQDYLRTLGKAQELMLAKKVDLMMRNPVFAPWSRSSLLKLSYFFKERTFQRKQVLFRSGDPAYDVFLVKSGEFSLMKDISVQVRKVSSQIKDFEQTKCQAEVTLASVGELLGGVEVIRNLPHRYTCVCSSAEAEVLAISKDDFLKRMTSEEAVNIVLSLSETVEHQRDLRLKRISDRERSNRDLSIPQSPLAECDLPGSLQHAKRELEAEVRDRWFLPKLSKKPSVSHCSSVSPANSPRPIECGSPFTIHTRAASELIDMKILSHGEWSPEPGKGGKSPKKLKAILHASSPRKKLLRKVTLSSSKLDTMKSCLPFDI